MRLFGRGGGSSLSPINRLQLKEEKTLAGQRLEKQLRACLMYIATVSVEQSEHVPNISDLTKPFPYKIIVANGAPETLVGMLRKMVADSSVPPLLG